MSFQQYQIEAKFEERHPFLAFCDEMTDILLDAILYPGREDLAPRLEAFHQRFADYRDRHPKPFTSNDEIDMDDFIKTTATCYNVMNAAKACVENQDLLKNLNFMRSIKPSYLDETQN